MNKIIIAHRGASGYYCENTLSAFEYAYELGCRHIELDCQLSRDGMVIFHDDTLKRLSGADLAPPKNDIATLKQQDLYFHYEKDKAAKPLSALPAKIITLQEFLNWTDSRCEKLWVNFELKCGLGDPIETAEKLAEILNSAHLTCDACISSFDFTALAVCKKLLKTPAEFAPLYYKPKKNMLQQAQELGASAIHLGRRQAKENDIAKIKDGGLQVRIYTVNDVESAEQFFTWGADAVFSDFPDRLL